jgi:serine/threonine-protein kinase RsbW
LDAPPEVRDVVALMVSELATNCIRHTDSGFDLTISQARGEVRVEATDRGGGEPTVRTPAPTDPSGRGLQIIDMFSTAWGHKSRPGAGKTVWFSVSLEPVAAA